MPTTAFTVVSDTVHIIQGQVLFKSKVVIIGTSNVRKIFKKKDFSFNYYIPFIKYKKSIFQQAFIAVFSLRGTKQSR